MPRSWRSGNDIVINAGGLGFDSRADQIGQSRNGESRATFLRSCAVQALSRGDGSRHSLHASA